MSLQRTIHAILMLGLSGCTTVDYQTPPARINQFDEGVTRKAVVVRKQAMPTPTRTPTPKSQSSDTMLPEQADDVAISIPAPSGSPLITTSRSQPVGTGPSFVIEGRSGPRTDADDVFDEGMRVGATGDIESKIGLLQQSGAMGNGDALYELAKMYQRGTGIPTDMEQSIVHLNRAQGLGHVESTRVLGTLYLTAQGVPKDVEYGMTLLDQAAETSVRAMREYGQYLGNLRQPYLNDPSKGAVLLRRAADQGDAESAKLLTTLLDRQGDHAGAAAVKGTFLEPAPLTVKTTPVAYTAETSAEAVKSRALSGDLEAAYQYGLNVQLQKYPSVDPEFDSYCWYGAAAKLGLEKAKVELGPIAGAKQMADRKTPGRMDNCIAGLVEVMQH